MYHIKRYENRWVEICYTLDLTDEYIERLNNDLKFCVPSGVELPVITAEDVIDIVSCNNNDKVDIKVYAYNCYRTRTYETTIRSIVQGLVNDDLWTCDYKTIESGSDRYEDKIDCD